MEDDQDKKLSGCGLLLLYNNVFRRQPTPNNSPPWQRPPSASTNSNPSSCPPPQSTHKSSFAAPSNINYDHDEDSPVKVVHKINAPPSNYPKASSRGRPTPNMLRPTPGIGRGHHHGHGGGGGISMELDSMLNDQQRTKGGSTLVRASSGNVMLYGNLGNLRAPGAVTSNRNVLDHLPKTAKEKNTFKQEQQQSYGNGMLLNGHTQTKEEEEEQQQQQQVPAEGVMCRALSRRLDPEELKEMGNEEYKQGNFAEAVALYDRAILMDAEKASYWSNKAAALTGLGKLIDAVTECREAIRIKPSYCRAHHRLATLYLRLGEAEKSLHHYKLSRNEANSTDISRAQSLQKHLSKCMEARRLEDWHSMLKETQSAISLGVDSSPQVFAFKAEALLMLHKHEEADATLKGTPKFDIDACTKFFGAMKNAFALMVRAQVDMAAGRFEDALLAANRAAQLDTSSGEAGALARKAREVSSARATGNDLFKASKFKEACGAYGEGLHHDSHNAILMCNRAACLSKLSQWEKAIEDCTAALNLRPSYTKARLRRADCYTKLEQWEASIQDYGALLHEMPEDEEVRKALHEAQAQLGKI